MTAGKRVVRASPVAEASVSIMRASIPAVSMRLVAAIALTAVGCAGSRVPAGEALSAPTPPAPRIGDGGGRDPMDELPVRLTRVKTPLPPIADPGALPSATGLPSPSDEGATLYVIGERRITEASLGDFLLRYFPDRARDPLGQLVDEALVETESTALGVDVAPEFVIERANEHIEARRKKVRVEYGADASLEDMLAASFGRSIAEFEADARRLARIALLRDRLVRLDQIRVDRVEVRAMTFPDQAGADLAVERLRAGADMTLLAQRLGLREPAAPPPFARDDIHPPDRADEVFAAAAGHVLDARPFEGTDGGTWFEVIKIVNRTDARVEPWSELRDDVVRGLAESPVGVPEYLAWRRRAIRRAMVEVRRAGAGLVPWLPEATPSDAADQN